MRLKVLRLLPYMKRLDRGNFPEGYFTTFEPRIGRDGYYLLGKDCWFEIDGVAYTNDHLASSFHYDMRGYNRMPIGTDAMRALRAALNKLPSGYMHLAVQDLLRILDTPFPQNRLPLYQHRKRIRSMARKKGWPEPFTDSQK